MGDDSPSASIGRVAALSAGSSRDGVKVALGRAAFARGVGIVGDAHAGNGHRQVSLIAHDAGAGAGVALGENVSTRGLRLETLADGRRVRIGARAVLQVTQRELDVTNGAGGILWVFARVLRSGEVVVGDAIATDASLDRPRFAVITLSDRRALGAAPDESGALASAMLGEALGAEALATDVLPDDAEQLKGRLVALADDEMCDLIVTTGGTGLAPRDVTPEATLAVIDREVPGVAEAIRAGGLAKTPFAMLSRGVCGQRGACLIVNLSGSPRAVREQLAILLPVLPHVLTTASGVPQSCAELSRHGHR